MSAKDQLLSVALHRTAMRYATEKRDLRTSIAGATRTSETNCNASSPKSPASPPEPGMPAPPLTLAMNS